MGLYFLSKSVIRNFCYSMVIVFASSPGLTIPFERHLPRLKKKTVNTAPITQEINRETNKLYGEPTGEASVLVR